MQLQEFLNIHGKLDLRQAAGDSPVQGLSSDSRKIQPGFVFVAVRGHSSDGHNFLSDVVKKGALALVVEDAALVPGDFKGAVVEVLDSRLSLQALSQRFYAYPGEKMRSVAVTGTNGKTSCAYIIEYLLNQQSLNCGVIGTIDHHLGGKVWPTGLTSPDPMTLQQRLNDFLDAGAKSFVMETSSHALDQSRVAQGFDVTVFTNLSRDHLDYHGDMDSYFEAKAKLFQEFYFKESGDNFAVINADDTYGKRLLSLVEGRRIFSFGRSADSDFCFKEQRQSLQACQFNLKTPEAGDLQVVSPLIGEHNIYNVVAGLAVIYSLGLDLKKAIKDIKSFPGIPGRMQMAQSKSGLTGFVDYAHTPDALENAIKALKPLIKKGNKLITVFGCGGDRDRGKRPMMAQVASSLSEVTIVTSDNPRSEDPMAIIDEIKPGLEKKEINNHHFEVSREKAIQLAASMALPGDAILIAGKGHEDYQIIGDEKKYFSDFEVLSQALDGSGR